MELVEQRKAETLAREHGVYDAAPDDSDPDETWQENSIKLREQNDDAGKPPYFGLHIESRGQLTWLLASNAWAGNRMQLIGILPDRSAADLRRIFLGNANFTRAVLVKANLTDTIIALADLSGADLSEAKMVRAHMEVGVRLRGALLNKADFTDAVLWDENAAESDTQGQLLGRADLTGARLVDATLRKALLREVTFAGAFLRRADLRDADLRGADLTGADLHAAKLQGADLRGVRLDVTTDLSAIEIDRRTRCSDVIWNGTPLAQVDWSKARRIGDEEVRGESETAQDKAARNRDATRAYRGLATALRSQGLADVARTYRLAGQRTARKAAFWQRSIGRWLVSWILNITSGYGERPLQAIGVYIALICSFMGAFLFATHQFSTSIQPLNWYEALVLSITSFHGRGQTPGSHLGDPVAVIAAFEAVIGLFVEISFIAAFTRRLLED